MPIYTRRGDRGMTQIWGGAKSAKSEPVVEALGTVDELNAAIGVVLAGKGKLKDGKVREDLEEVQKGLMVLGSVTAGYPFSGAEEFFEKQVVLMEKEIDRMTAKMPALANFILPGGSERGAALHLARAVCRRAERRLARLAQGKEKEFGGRLKYANRLSDYLFTLARYVNFLEGIEEKTWTWRY